MSHERPPQKEGKKDLNRLLFALPQNYTVFPLVSLFYFGLILFFIWQLCALLRWGLYEINQLFSEGTHTHTVCTDFVIALFIWLLSSILSISSQLGSGCRRFHLLLNLLALFVPVATLRHTDPRSEGLSLPHLQCGNGYGFSTHRNVWRQRYEPIAILARVIYRFFKIIK